MEIRRREAASESGPQCSSETRRSRRMEAGDETTEDFRYPLLKTDPRLFRDSNLCIHVCPSPKSPVIFMARTVPATRAQYS